MAKKRQLPQTARHTRYEYRVWGKHRSARDLLSRLASGESKEQVADCYLLVDDPSLNAKVRNGKLKIKRLVDEDKGFEQWTSRRHRTSASVPAPFDQVFKKLRLDRAQRCTSADFRKAVAGLDDESGVTAVFVTKRRRLFEIGDLRAEVTDIEVDATGEVLHTLSIEGDDLEELVSLRKKLDLRDEPNVAVHEAISAEVAF